MMKVNIMNPEQIATHATLLTLLLERKISTSTSALETEIIFNPLSLTAEVKENHFHLHTLTRILDWTFRARGLSLEFWSD